MNDKTVCLVGLGYVGLPLAEAFARHLKVTGYDIEDKKRRELNAENDKENIEFTTDSSMIKHADFVIIAVPTPVTKSNLIEFNAPDLRYVKLFCFAKTFTKKCLRYQPQKQSARL